MNILQTILNPSSKTVKFDRNFTESITDVVILEQDNVPGEQDNDPEFDKDFQYVNPTNDAVMKNIPHNFYNVSSLEICLFFYAILLQIENFFTEAWDGVKYVWNYHTKKQSVKALERNFQIKKKALIQQQVRAMIPHIVQFNSNVSYWEQGKSGDMFYQIRNPHTLVKNRNISRHWSQNTPQVVS